jgi:5'-3' exonuclease
MKKVLIIDCNAVCWSVFHALPPMTFEEEGTAIIYGFMNHLFDIQSYQNADHIAFVWDSRRSLREDIFPEYKLKRRTKQNEYTEEELVIHSDRARQFKVLRTSILPSLGFSNVFQEEGYEGDDIIASIVNDFKDTHMITIVGRDNDLYQLIGPNCSLWDHVGRFYFDEEAFFEKYNVYPDMWADIKAIAGCSSDEVPGVEGIGVDRAIKYLTGGMKVTSKLFQRIENSPELIAFTRRLTQLPFEGTPHYTLKEDTCKVYKLKQVAKRYGLESYLVKKRYRQFRRHFGGEKNTQHEDGTRVERTSTSIFNSPRKRPKVGMPKRKG